MDASVDTYGYRSGLLQTGYTMLEILVVLAIVGVLAALTAPSFQDSIRRNARESAMLEMTTALALARSEAVTRARTASICRSVDMATCAASTGGDWDAGWIVFIDTGTAGVVDGTDSLVQVRGAGNGQAVITLKTRLNGNFTGDFLRFDEEGFLESSSNGAYFKLCAPDNVLADARAIWLSNTGRPAMSVDDGNGIHNDLAGTDLICP